MWKVCERWHQTHLRQCLKTMKFQRSRRTSGSTAASFSSRSQSDQPPLAFFDVPYYEGDGACNEKHRLDIYIPSAPFPRPLSRTCLFVHGGSWQRGDRRVPSMPDELYGNVGRAFARAGLVALVMSYRLAPGFQHPEQVRDIARAMRWARENVWRYGGSGDDLVLVGHSAGAHLAALCLADGRLLLEEGAVRAGTIAANAPAANALQAPVVIGFVGISGVYDVLRMGGNVVGAALARAAFGDDRRGWKDASPLHRVRAVAAAGRRLMAIPLAATAIARAVGAPARAPSFPAPASDTVRGDQETEGTMGGNERRVEPDGAEQLAAATCPLVYTHVLLLTASSDFHLKEDAEALAEALGEARKHMGGASGTKSTGGTGDSALQVGSRGQPPRSAGGGQSRAPPKAENDPAGVGSVRNVCLKGEDHLSTMISFGEPGKEASEVVLDFILSLPSLRK